MISGVREGQKGSYAYVGKVEGRKIVGAEEFVEEGKRERVDDAVRAAVEGESLLPVGGVVRIDGAVGVLSPVTVIRGEFKWMP